MLRMSISETFARDCGLLDWLRAPLYLQHASHRPEHRISAWRRIIG